MRSLLSLALLCSCAGCVPFAVWVTAHQAEVAGVAAIGGAVYAVEQAGIGAIDLGQKVKEATKGE